jgi:hypothetical protein
MTAVKNHEDWEYYDLQLNKKGSGNGVASLRAILPDNEVGFGVFRIQAENVNNTGPG